MPYSPVDMGDRGYGGGPPGARPRPPYAVMVGYPQDLDNSISDTFGMPYGELRFTFINIRTD